MKPISIIAALLLTTLASASLAQAPAAADPKLLLALKEVQAQQTAIADNQAKIDAKLAAVAEAIRLARIYSSRAGN